MKKEKKTNKKTLDLGGREDRRELGEEIKEKKKHDEERERDRKSGEGERRKTRRR